MKFVSAEDETMVNLDHVIEVSTDGLAQLVNGTSRQLYHGWEDAIEHLGVAPAKDGTRLAVAYRNRESEVSRDNIVVEYFPVVGWSLHVEGAKPILPDGAGQFHLMEQPTAVVVGDSFIYGGGTGDNLGFRTYAADKLNEQQRRYLKAVVDGVAKRLAREAGQ